MAGRTGYTNVLDTDLFDVAADVNKVFAWFDARTGETSSGAFPTVGLWIGRCVYRTDLGSFSVWNGASWVRIGGVPNGGAVKRSASTSAYPAGWSLSGGWSMLTDSRLWNVDGNLLGVTFNGMFTVQQPGRYLLSFGYQNNTSNTSQILRIRKNSVNTSDNSGTIAMSSTAPVASTTGTSIQVIDEAQPGDFYNASVWLSQADTGISPFDSTRFSMDFISPVR